MPALYTSLNPVEKEVFLSLVGVMGESQDLRFIVIQSHYHRARVSKALSSLMRKGLVETEIIGGKTYYDLTVLGREVGDEI